MTDDFRPLPLASERLPDMIAALREALLPTDDLALAGAILFAYELGGRVVGYGGFEPYGDDALVRSIVVLPDHRRQGVGRRISELLLAGAARMGARRGFLLTVDAKDYFADLGFSVIDRRDAPASILASPQARVLCPASAVIMVKATTAQ